MANTINVKIDIPKVWTEVFNTESTGMMTIAGSGQYCASTTEPVTDLIGHRFTRDKVAFTLGAGESLYVKADSVTTVIITED